MAIELDQAIDQLVEDISYLEPNGYLDTEETRKLIVNFLSKYYKPKE